MGEMQDSSAKGKDAGEKVPHKAKATVSKKRRKHKPKDFPKRPLSAYNIFFKETREVMLREKQEEVGKDNVDFQSMVREIAQKWKALPLDKRERVDKLAKDDLQRYKDEVKTYEEEMVKRSRKEREEAALRKQKEDEEAEVLAKAAEKEANDKQRKPPSAEDARFGALSESLHGAPRNLEEMRLILEEELSLIDKARDMKLRQLAQLQAGIIPQNMPNAGGLGTALSMGGLQGLGGLPGSLPGDEAAEQFELLVRQRQALAAAGLGGFGGGGASSLHAGLPMGGLQADLVSSLGRGMGLQGGSLAGLQSNAALAFSRQQQELAQRDREAILLRTIQDREKELFAGQLAGAGASGLNLATAGGRMSGMGQDLTANGGLGRGGGLLGLQASLLLGAGAAGGSGSLAGSVLENQLLGRDSNRSN